MKIIYNPESAGFDAETNDSVPSRSHCNHVCNLVVAENARDNLYSGVVLSVVCTKLVCCPSKGIYKHTTTTQTTQRERERVIIQICQDAGHHHCVVHMSSCTSFADIHIYESIMGLIALPLNEHAALLACRAPCCWLGFCHDDRAIVLLQFTIARQSSPNHRLARALRPFRLRHHVSAGIIYLPFVVRCPLIFFCVILLKQTQSTKQQASHRRSAATYIKHTQNHTKHHIARRVRSRGATQFSISGVYSESKPLHKPRHHSRGSHIYVSTCCMHLHATEAASAAPDRTKLRMSTVHGRAKRGPHFPSASYNLQAGRKRVPV